MKTSFEKFEKLSLDLASDKTRYKFNKSTNLCPKYTQGALTSIEYLQELIFYFMQKEKHLQQEFLDQLDEKEAYIKAMNNTAYRQGILDYLNIARKSLRNEEKEKSIEEIYATKDW